MYQWIAIACAVIGCVLQARFIAVEHQEKYVPAVILKGSASLMFVIIGAIGCFFFDRLNASNFSRLIFIGLVFGMLGDICLNLRFVLEKIGSKIFLVGIFLFLVGHVLYLCALIPLAKNVWLYVAIGAVLAAALLTYIFKTMEVKPAFKIFGIFYLGACIIMATMAVGICVESFMAGANSLRSLIFAIGAVLFMASDIVLIFNTFSGVTRFPLRITNLSLYYLGQLLIAGSLFFL